MDVMDILDANSAAVTNADEYTAAGKLRKRVRAMQRKMDAVYRRICTDGCSSSDGCSCSDEEFFADNYHTVSAGCDYLLGYDRLMSVSDSFELADIAIGCDEPLDADEFILKIKSLKKDCDAPALESLKYSVCMRLVGAVYSAVSGKKPDIELRHAVTILSRLSSLDDVKINDELNPVCRALAHDEVYMHSDLNTKHAYRTRLYRMASLRGVSAQELASHLVKTCDSEGIINALELNKPQKAHSAAFAVLSAAVVTVMSAAIAFGIAAWADAVWMGVLLILPAICAVKAVYDKILLRTCRHRRLARLDPSCDTVENTPCAVVMSAVIGEPADADALYDRLYRLYAANPQDNIKMVALCDFAPSSSQVTADDMAVVESLNETVKRLNSCPEIKSNNRFVCMLRKRSYSKTQGEYMGAGRKRGAIISLCRFMAGTHAKNSEFYFVSEGAQELVGIKYICAVDSDTEPQMDSVRELLSIALHPANKPVIKDGRVISGCALISPRMVTRLGDSISTRFARGMGGIGSLSGYDGDGTDVWHDAFGRGSFCGKGLISVEAMIRCTSFLCDERLLSHDIIEGELLHSAYASDVVFYEGFPKNAVSYCKRLDRWIRGDVQNIPFLFCKKLDAISKLKILDNIRRAVTPAAVFAAFYFSLLVCPWAYWSYNTLLAAAVVMYLFPEIWGLLSAAFRKNASHRRYFSFLLNESGECLERLVYQLVMLPAVAVKSARAVFVGAVRLISRKKLLEWTTSAAADKSGTDPFRYFFFSEVLSAVLLFSMSTVCKVFALVFCAMPILISRKFAAYSPSPLKSLSDRDRRELSGHVASMWKFFADYVTEADNYLPVDNVQFAPVYRICHRTSPTNIGMYMLSALAACDRRLISVHNLSKRISYTLCSIEKLEKYHGNLYNWYNTSTLEVCPAPYVSSVDSANFVCSLVALKEGLKEYLTRCPELLKQIRRIEKIIAETDLGIFYDSVRGLMSIGINPASGTPDKAKYDFLMSEARLGSYYAVASRQVPKSHWYRLSRTMLSSGAYSGAASYSGTMFEYFMPCIFLESPDGSLQRESLKYALRRQISYAESMHRPYGISESGYYSFDSSLSYRYLAHGVPGTGVKRGLESDYVVSPYSTYISMELAPQQGMQNLKTLKKYGMYSRYGFYEALDFTPPGSKSSEPAVVKSYMSHHVGMSILAAVNLLEDGIFRKRFSRDVNVLGADELIQERPRLDANICENMLIKPKDTRGEPVKSEPECYECISVSNPHARLLTNGEYTLVLTDSGISCAMYRQRNLYSKTKDRILRPKGAFFGISDGKTASSLCRLPDPSADAKGFSCEFANGYAAYYKNVGALSAGMKVGLHESMPCEIRTFALENTSSEQLSAKLFAYIEPSLASDGAESAHPAFNKLFLRADYDAQLKLATVTRSDDFGVGTYMAVGFYEDVSMTVSLDREEVLHMPDGVCGLFNCADSIPQSYISEPDPCVFMKVSLNMPPKSETELHMFILAADSYDELIASACRLRGEQKIAMFSPKGMTQAQRFANRLLPAVLFKPESSEKRIKATLENKLPLRALWELSVSVDIPLILVELTERVAPNMLYTYLRAYSELVIAGIKVQLAVLYDDGGESAKYERKNFSMLVSAARDAGVEGMLYSPGGIIGVDVSEVRQELVTLLKAYACHISEEELSGEEPAERDNMVKVLSVEADKQSFERDVRCGGFRSDGAYVITERPPLPWCHVLSSQQFGILCSSGSMGFCYAFNSRELRLTPWDNDTSRDNIGQRLILAMPDGYYDIVSGACAAFSENKAEYFFKKGGASGSVELGVSQKGMCARISVKLRGCKGAKLCLLLEPCLDESRNRAYMILPQTADDRTLVLSNPASLVSGYMAVNCSRDCVFSTDRERVLSGRFDSCVSPASDPAAACICGIDDDEWSAEFYLSYALSKKAAAEMHRFYAPQKSSCEHELSVNGIGDMDVLVNHTLRYQALHARIMARTGFYQCSGAYGFRDQLQDAVGILLQNPSACLRQILLCCGAQFEEGDVLHWWHVLPQNNRRGIRTKISDDNLWLVYAVCEYVNKTGDASILDIKASYCAGIHLRSGQNECYGEVYKTANRESVYEHCKRAIDYRAGQTGEHGLMLIGTGDWNDGFSKLGEHGRGESVWLTEFYILVLRRFSKLCRFKDGEYCSLLDKYADELEKSITAHGRAQDWYLRAYADDGTPIGAPSSDACRIDSISQSFAQFANLCDVEFTKHALKSAYDSLADPGRGVIKLFTPAFKPDSRPYAGYICAYPEGIRENGGQYTHGAIWLGMALLRAGLYDEGMSVLKSISPIEHSKSERYKAEPYYVCADVYANKNCFSRGGWSIYTGSAAWYYKAITEDILGIRMEAGKLSVKKTPFNRGVTIKYDGKTIT